MATDIVTRTGKAAALSAADNDQNLESLSGTVDAKVAGYTVIATDQNKTIEFTSATAVTCALDAIATIQAAIDTTNFKVTVKNLGAGVCTIDPNGAETIDGSATFQLGQFDVIVLQINNAGTGWSLIGSANISPVFVNDSNGGPVVSETTVDFDAQEGLGWVSVGPTGSGATVTWTALDAVPLSADWLQLKVRWSVVRTGTTDMLVTMSARKNGTSPSAEAARIVYTLGAASVGGDATSGGVTYPKIQVDAANIFEVGVTYGTTPTTGFFVGMLAGYGSNA